MTTCVFIRRTAKTLTLSISGIKYRLTPELTSAFERAMVLKGLTHQEMFDYLMDSKWLTPWTLMERFARRLSRHKILHDASLGSLRLTRNCAGELQAYREGDEYHNRSNTSLVKAPEKWENKYKEVRPLKIYDKDGIYLFSQL